MKSCDNCAHVNSRVISEYIEIFQSWGNKTCGDCWATGFADKWPYWCPAECLGVYNEGRV